MSKVIEYENLVKLTFFSEKILISLDKIKTDIKRSLVKRLIKLSQSLKTVYSKLFKVQKYNFF